MNIRLTILSFSVLVLELCAHAQDFASPQKLVTIRSDKGAATGFYAKQGGTTYVYTSMFALSKGGLIFYSSDGKQIKTGQFEIASDRDLVRTPVENAASFFEINEDNVMGEPVVLPAVAVKDDKATIQTYSGKVLGVGPEFFKITSPGATTDIVGAPVVSDNGKVIGAMSYEIPSLSRSMISKPNEKPVAMYVVRWDNNTCSRLNGDIRWIAAKPQEIAAQARLITDARNFIDGYMTVMHLWHKKPFDQIDPAGCPLEIKSWIEEHNKKNANSAKYIATIEKDINHSQELARQVQDMAKADGMRLSTFPVAKSTSLKNPEGSPFVKLYYTETMKVFDSISQVVTSRSANLSYFYPFAVVKGEAD